MFDQIVCTGVLHHLHDPDLGLRSLRSVLMPNGAMQLMVYAAYGRAGIYMVQEYCRLLGVATEAGLGDLGSMIGALTSTIRSPEWRGGPKISPILRHSLTPCSAGPCLHRAADLCLAGAVRRVFRALVRTGALHPTMRVNREDATRPASCLAAATIATRCGRAFARHHDQAHVHCVSRQSPRQEPADRVRWRRLAGLCSLRLPWTLCIRDRGPPGSVAVLINPGRTYPDLALPIDEAEHRIFAAIDGSRSIDEILPTTAAAGGRDKCADCSNGSGITIRSCSTPAASRADFCMRPAHLSSMPKRHRSRARPASARHFCRK